MLWAALLALCGCWKGDGGTNDVDDFFDGIVPVVGLSTSGQGPHPAGSSLAVSLHFSDWVKVTGAPRIPLRVGGRSRYAVYSSGSGTRNLSFTYQVQAGDLDTDGVEIAEGGLDLNSGHLRGAGDRTVNVDFGVYSPGITAMQVDGIAPGPVQLSLPPAGLYGPGDTLDYVVEFSETVTVTGQPRIALTLGEGTYYADYIAGSGTRFLSFRHVVEPDAFAPSGITTASVLDTHSGRIEDQAGNAASLAMAPADTSGVRVMPDGLSLWLDAQDSTTLWQTTGCSTTLSPVPATGNGDPVACWEDKSGLGHHAIAVAGGVPVLHNGAVRINGAANTNTTGACFDIPALSGQTMVGVFEDVGGTGGANGVLGGVYAGSAVYLFLSTNGFGPYAISFDGNVNEQGRYALNGDDFSAFGTNVGPASGMPASSLAYMEYQVPQNNWVTLGCFDNSGGQKRYHGNYRLREFLVFTSTLSISTKRKLEGYLACKWNRQADLPASHPYKTSCP